MTIRGIAYRVISLTIVFVFGQAGIVGIVESEIWVTIVAALTIGPAIWIRSSRDAETG